jgi:CelD/BcsL family acetyltransferase involved in cellulose biosynthesis
VYGWELFKEMFERYSPDVKLWLAVCYGKIIAGALCFYSKHHVAYWHGAAYSDYFKLRPVNLLMYEAIRHACEQGYSWFDFNPSGGHEGVKAFKRSFGTQEVLCPVVKTQSSFSKVLKLLQRKVRAL